MIDFGKLLGHSQDYNLHSHTQFCDGRNDMQTMAAAAVAQGYTHYGFTPHSPVPEAIDSPCSMERMAVPVYIAEVRRLQEYWRHKSPIRFLAGMEVDYIDGDWGPASPYFKWLGLDYVIGSVHFVPDKHGEPVDIDGSPQRFASNMAARFDRDIDYVVEQFYAQSLAMVRAGGFDILGHLDKIGHNASSYAPGIEDGEHYRRCLSSLVDAVITSGVTVEVNTKAWTRASRMFPSEQALLRLVETGVPIIVNSDAHYADRIDSGRAEALKTIADLQKNS